MASAYVKDDEGGTFIPASQRPDGTWRKPRRVKDGYVPQEEVPLYESKGKQFTKNKPTYPVGMSPEYVEAQRARNKFEATKTNPIPGLIIQPEDLKKKKKKNKNKGVNSLTDELVKAKISDPSSKEKQKNTKECSKIPEVKNLTSQLPNKQISTVDPLKRLKNLRKKIKEIDNLDKKIKSGEIKNPDMEMLNKISRKKEIQKEINELESNQ